MFAFICGDVRDSGEDVSAVCGGTFNAVSVIDSALARFVINVEILQIVVEIDAASAEITTEESSMGGEHGRNVYVTLAQERDSETRLPLVEMRYDGRSELSRDVLDPA